jgi:exopolyphosphatase/guanosine-5'-triphosphate,3'-diphosphate pyrophosphatase
VNERASPAPRTLAGVDLGSNAFKLVLARSRGEDLVVLDSLREPVRLAAGLDERGLLSDEAVARALAALERFRQRLSDVPPGLVRAVGTNTLRRAKNRGTLLPCMSRALGAPIEIISGPEEARLVWLGVAHDLAQNGGRRIVIDIGGGSTECILGEGRAPSLVDSLQMGCVTFSARHFADGGLSKKAFQRAELAAALELETIAERYRALGWSECVGSSGTILAIAEVLRAQGWGDGTIELEGLKRLQKELVEAGASERLALKGLEPERAPVLPGGLAILRACFESLALARLRPARWALREGLLYDLLGRLTDEDVRERTIRSMMDRYQIDRPQAARVEATALALFDALAPSWALDVEPDRRFLAWAARLHELGLAVAYSGHHKHGAYILANAALAGFSREDQEMMAALVRGHRRRLAGDLFAGLPAPARTRALRLCVLLRLAVVLNRSRTSAPLPSLRAAARGDHVELAFPPTWLDSHPLTRADLEDEGLVLRGAGLELVVD